MFKSYMVKKFLLEEIVLFFILMCLNEFWLYYYNFYNELILN